jgi:hypothetical protein
MAEGVYKTAKKTRHLIAKAFKLIPKHWQFQL